MNPAKAIERVNGGMDFRDEKTLMCYISILFSICFIIGKKIDCLKNLLIFMLFTYNRIHVNVSVRFACAQDSDFNQ